MANFEQRRAADGTISYRVRVRLRGQPAAYASFARLTDARRWAQETEVSIRQGRYFKAAEASKHTVGDLVDRYLREGFADRLKTAGDRKRHLLAWKAMIGSTLLSELTPSVIATCRSKLQNERGARRIKLASSTVNRHLAALSHALRIASREWEWIDDSPMRKITKLKEPKGRTRFLSDDERSALLRACRGSDSQTLYTVVVLALSTGMRRGEIMNLRWRQVDLKRAAITLHETKNGDSRSLPLAGHALELMTTLSKVRRLDSDMVFPGKTKGSAVDLKKPWTTACRRAGLTDFRFHDLRHSAASYLAMTGASTIEIAAVLGHKTLAMVKRYSHLTTSHTAQVVKAMNQKIFAEASSG